MQQGQEIEGSTGYQLHVCHPDWPLVCQTNVYFAFQACFKEYLSYVLINWELIRSYIIQSWFFFFFSVSALGQAKNESQQGLGLTIVLIN